MVVSTDRLAWFMFPLVVCKGSLESTSSAAASSVNLLHLWNYLVLVLSGHAKASGSSMSLKDQVELTVPS